MKNFLLFVLTTIMLIAAKQSDAQNLIAVTNETSSLFYDKLDLALTNTVDGDVLYLPGGIFSISIPINKRIQIFGTGHNPDSCKATGITQITGNISLASGSSGGSLNGCKIMGNITFFTGSGQTINNYSIERCNISNGINLTSQTSNILISECVLSSISISGGSPTVKVEGLLVLKCIILSNLSYLGSNCHFTNNIFSLPTSTGNLNLTYITNCYFRNNIFMNPVANWEGTSNNVFENNLFNKGQTFLNSSFFNSITGPLTILFKRKTKDGFDYDQDYHILETSPAFHAGTDGTDLGIYGTANPWKEGSLPSNPHIQTKMIYSTGGNLNVKIKVVAQDN